MEITRVLKPLLLIRRRFASIRWRTRVTLWVAATLAGLLVVMFARLADLALTQFAQQTAERPWLPFVYTPLVGMLVVWLTTRFFVGSQGSGIPQVIAATRLAHQGKPVDKLVSLRILLFRYPRRYFCPLPGGRCGNRSQCRRALLSGSTADDCVVY